MNHAAITIMPACGAYHLRNLLEMSVNKFVYTLILVCVHALLQTMFYALTRKTSAKVASCRPRVYADLSMKGDSSIMQQVEKYKTLKITGLGFTSDNEILKWLKDDHSQLYEEYKPISVVQSILSVSGTLDAHSDVRKFGGDCNNTAPNNTVPTCSWGIHPNVKLLLLFFSFVVQYVCIHLYF